MSAVGSESGVSTAAGSGGGAPCSTSALPCSQNRPTPKSSKTPKAPSTIRFIDRLPPREDMDLPSGHADPQGQKCAPRSGQERPAAARKRRRTERAQYGQRSQRSREGRQRAERPAIFDDQLALAAHGQVG